MVAYTDTTSLLQDSPIQYRQIPTVPFRTQKYTSKSKYKSLQILKLIIGAVTLFPIRVVLLVFSFSLAYVTSYVAQKLFLLGVPVGDQTQTSKEKVKEKDAPKKFKPNLNYCKYAAHSWAVFITNRIVRLALFSLGLTSIKFKGKIPVDYDQDQPWLKYSVVAGPHSGTFDWSLIVAKMTRILSPTIKIEAYKPVSHYIDLTSPIVIDRLSNASRKQAVLDTNQRIKEGCKKGWFPILSFPEGTNGNRKQFLRFKAGPFIAGQPLIPVIINYPQDELLDDNDLLTWAHFGRSVLCSIFMCMCRLNTTIIYNFLDPYFPTLEEQKCASLYAENVRQLMSKVADLPTSDWCFEDVKLMKRCKSKGFQPEIGAIKVMSIFENLDLGQKDYNYRTFEQKTLSDLLDLYLTLLKQHMTKIELKNQVDPEINLLPVVNRDILMEKLLKSDIYPVGTDMTKVKGIYRKSLPNYVSFEQLVIVFGEVLRMKG